MCSSPFRHDIHVTAVPTLERKSDEGRRAPGGFGATPRRYVSFQKHLGGAVFCLPMANEGVREEQGFPNFAYR